VLNHVEFVEPVALALRVLDGEGPVTNDTGESNPLPGCEIEPVTAADLPGEVASDAEPANMASQEKLVPYGRS
jgi:hypothetical protein